MDGLSGNGSGSRTDSDVLKSLPPGRSSDIGRHGQRSVRQQDVTHSLMLDSLRKRSTPVRSLDEFRKLHQIDPNRSISDKLEALGTEEPSFDDEGLFMSIQNDQFDEFGRRTEESSDTPLHDIDVNESLIPSSLDHLRPQGEVDIEASLIFSTPGGFLSEEPEDDDDITQAQSLTDAQELKSDDDDDMFYSAQSSSPYWSQQELEKSVAASLMASTQTGLPSPQSPLAPIWSRFNHSVSQHLDTQAGENIAEALNAVLDHYPAVTNRQKVIDVIMRNVESLENSDEITSTSQQLLAQFKIAGELSLKSLKTYFQKACLIWKHFRYC